MATITDISETLKNGAVLIERRNQIVLAKNPGNTLPFVTWQIDTDGNTYLGHYFETIELALADFLERTA